MALDEQRIIAGLEKLKARTQECVPWQHDREKGTKDAVDKWWRELVAQRPRAEATYEIQRVRSREANQRRLGKSPCSKRVAT